MLDWPNEIIDFINTSILRDDFESMRSCSALIDKYKVSHPHLKVIQFYCEARIFGEENWNYQPVYNQYQNAVDHLQKYLVKDEEIDFISNWLLRAAMGQMYLHKALASWTLANYNESSQYYHDSSKEFENILSSVPSGQTDKFKIAIIEYARGWYNFSEGDYHNVLGYLYLRQNQNELAEQEFIKSGASLKMAIKSFGVIRNRRGIAETKAHITKINDLKNVKMIYATQSTCIWMDFFHSQPETLIQMILKTFPGWKRMGEYGLLSIDPTRFKRRRLYLGTVQIASNIGGQLLPLIDVYLEILPKYCVAMVYSISTEKPLDVIDLFIFKILNTYAVPEYNVKFTPVKSKIRSLELTGRLTDVSLSILSNLLKLVSGNMVQARDHFSYSTLIVDEFSDEGVTTKNLIDNYPYLKGLFSSGEIWSWSYITQFADSKIQNLTEDLSEVDLVIYSDEQHSIIFGTNTPEWETRMYLNVIILNLMLKTISKRYISLMSENKARTLNRLKILRRAISEMEIISKEDATKFMSETINVKLLSQDARGVVRTISSIPRESFGEIRIFSERLQKSLRIDNELDNLEESIHDNEIVHDMAYNTSQEYLSWLITLNSDHTNKMLTFFNIVTVISLGLSVATSIFKTPIEITIAFMAMGITAIIGMIYVGIYKFLYYRQKKHD